MKKKGFTLIELLAIIIILAVIALIATPIMLNVIDEARESADKSTVYALLDSAHLYYTESIFDDNKTNKINNLDNLYDEVILGGEVPDEGRLYVNDKSETALSVIIHDKCYIKDFSGELEVRDKSDCDLGYIGNDSINPIVSFSALGDKINSNGWAKEDFYVSIEVEDLDSGGDSYKWCSGASDCVPTSLVSNSIGSSLIMIESDSNVVCAVGIDRAGNQSEVTCSDAYKLDKTNPSFDGIEDLIVNKNDVVDLSSGVSVSDSLSGIDGTFTYNPTSVDTTVAGTINVTYTVSDLAGNTNTVTRKVIVDAEAPTVTYTVLGDKINSNGWSKEDFYVEVTINDQSGLGIASAKWCSTTNDTCEPLADMVGTSMTPLVSLESNNNRICIQAIDNNGKTSEVICSDAYKLDKTNPNVGCINIVGILGSNNWYTSDVTITALDGNDVLSGHDSTTVDISSITSNTTGTTVTLTTKDLAGNTSSTSEVVKVDKDTPSITSKSGTFEIMEGDSVDTSTYFDSPVYSISGGSMSCSPSNTSGLGSGSQIVTCTVTGNNGLTSTASKTIDVNILEFVDSSGANQPELFNNMVPVKYNGSNWIVADISQEWYDYDEKEWANAVVFNIGITKNVGDIIDVNAEVSQMYVWIPRYKYKIFNGNNGSVSEQEINITFETEISSTGTVTCTDNSDGSETCIGVSNYMSTYTHPAFTLGSKELRGIWVGKFETNAPMINGVVRNIFIKPNVGSGRGINISEFYRLIKDLSIEYGLSADTHMMKNMEWGAVAYLSHSKYGKNGEVWKNNSSIYRTGCAGSSASASQYPGCQYAYDTVNGQNASTTGNIYGVYDMSGGSYEYVMGNMAYYGNFYSLEAGFNIIPESKYYDIYKYAHVSSTSHNRGKLGDATKETLVEYGNISGGWYSDYARFPDYSSPWFVRGGIFYDNTSKVGIFSFDSSNGSASGHYTNADYTARVVVSD